MEDPEDLVCSRLERCTYRHLQQLAKSMSLPSNVKKVQLIKMLRAKKYKSSEELSAIVVSIREERRRLSQIRKPTKKRKKCFQAEVSSSSILSAPISHTPTRYSDDMISYPPRARPTILKHQERSKITLPTITKTYIESDRVLRSFHNRMRPNNNPMNFNDSFIELIEAQNARLQQEGQYHLSMALQRKSQCVIKRPFIYEEHISSTEHQIDFDMTNCDNSLSVPITRSQNYSPAIPSNRQRQLSGIDPLLPSETAHYMRSFGIHSVSKMNTIVQKPLVTTLKPKDRNKGVRNQLLSEQSPTHLSKVNQRVKPIILRRNAPKTRPVVPVNRLNPRLPGIVTMQDIVDYKIDHCSFSNSSTETETETTARRENIESDHRNRCNAVVNLNRLTESANCGTQTEKCYTGSANYAQYRHRPTETTNQVSNIQNGNITKLATVNGPREEVYSMETITEYVESRNNMIENIISATDNRPTYIDSSNYAIENSNGYSEYIRHVAHSGSHDIEGINSQSLTHHIDPQNVENYPNMSALIDIDPNSQLISEQSSNYLVYYHKKIRSVQLRSQRPLVRDAEAAEEMPPGFSEVFNQYHGAEVAHSHPLNTWTSNVSVEGDPNNNSHAALESLYNFKCPLVTNQLLDMPRTKDNTQCVYVMSAPIVTTAVTQQSSANRNDAYPHSLVMSAHGQRVSEHQNIELETVPRLYDYSNIAEQDPRDLICNEVLSRSDSSFASTSTQEFGGDTTIPDMVEDALELISQDGDYLEGIGMDERMQCILCEWAGPQIILEYHIRREHTSQLVELSIPAWRVSVPIGSTAGGEGSRGRWRCDLVLYKQNIYVLATKCSECHGFMAVLMVLPTVTDDVAKTSRITVYDKVTGQPHAWVGAICYLPDTMPYETRCDGLKLDITSSYLAPSNANLKLLNGDSTINSTSEVGVGHTESNYIEVDVEVFE